jgi:hypothetical protein
LGRVKGGEQAGGKVIPTCGWTLAGYFYEAYTLEPPDQHREIFGRPEFL